MMLESNVKWIENLHFEAEFEGFKLDIDNPVEEEKVAIGPRPKVLLLTSLAGCTAMDVISILKKMKEEIVSFNVNVTGDTAKEHPKRIISLKVSYEIEGKSLNIENIKRAVSLSIEKYCGVYATLAESVPIETVIIVNRDIIS